VPCDACGFVRAIHVALVRVWLVRPFGRVH
jgi:hypothetical protein